MDKITIVGAGSLQAFDLSNLYCFIIVGLDLLKLLCMKEFDLSNLYCFVVVGA